MLSAQRCLLVLDALAQKGCTAWVAGGWGVDALVGRQTRTHRDLDLLIDADHLHPALRVLEALGYAVETDWLPVRVELAAAGHGWVDVHPVVFDDRRNGVQAGLDGAVFRYPARCLVSGTIGDRVVRCLSVERQLAAHAGYPPREVDLADLALLNGLAGY